MLKLVRRLIHLANPFKKTNRNRMTENTTNSSTDSALTTHQTDVLTCELSSAEPSLLTEKTDDLSNWGALRDELPREFVARGRPARRAENPARSRSLSAPRYTKQKEDISTTVLSIDENATMDEQNLLFEEMRNDARQQIEWNKTFPPGTIVIYTDGSCMNNEASGFGIYHGPRHPLNRAVRINGPEHNSSLAEISAATNALEDLASWDGYNNEPVILRTDHLGLVQAMTKGTNGGSRFSREYDILREKARAIPNGVQFEHVYGHDGDPGNGASDELARQGMESGYIRPRSHSQPPQDERRSRSRSRDRSQERGRSASRDNNQTHIRTHSAFVAGRATSRTNQSISPAPSEEADGSGTMHSSVSAPVTRRRVSRPSRRRSIRRSASRRAVKSPSKRSSKSSRDKPQASPPENSSRSSRI